MAHSSRGGSLRLDLPTSGRRWRINPGTGISRRLLFLTVICLPDIAAAPYLFTKTLEKVALLMIPSISYHQPATGSTVVFGLITQV